MQAGTELSAQQIIDQPVPRHAVQSVKPCACDGDVEMRLSPAAKRFRPGVMGVAGAVIMDFELCGREFFLKEGRNPFASAGGRCGGV